MSADHADCDTRITLRDGSLICVDCGQPARLPSPEFLRRIADLVRPSLTVPRTEQRSAS